MLVSKDNFMTGANCQYHDHQKTPIEALAPLTSPAIAAMFRTWLKQNHLRFQLTSLHPAQAAHP